MPAMFQVQRLAQSVGAVLSLMLFGAAGAQLVEPAASAASTKASAADVLTAPRSRQTLRPAPIKPAPISEPSTTPGLGQPVTPQIRIPLGKTPPQPKPKPEPKSEPKAEQRAPAPGQPG